MNKDNKKVEAEILEKRKARLSRRIDNAIFLLKENTEQNILDIALACGYNNTANFNKAFKKVTGTTPSKYRNSDDILL